MEGAFKAHRAARAASADVTRPPQDIVQEALKGAIIMAIMERLFLTRNANWLEEHIDYLSLNALMFEQQRAGLGFVGQVRLFFRHTRRLDS